MRPNARAWFVVFVCVVFGAGAGTGFLLRPSIESTAAASGLASSHPSREADSPAQLVGALAQALALTETQRQQIEATLTARRETLHAFREDVQKQIEEQRRATMADIERVLTPDQQRRFEVFVEQRRASRSDERLDR